MSTEVKCDCGCAWVDTWDGDKYVCSACLLAHIAELEADREQLSTELGNFQASIASALGWDTQGKSMDECVRELKAIVEKLPKTADGVPIVINDWVWFNLAGVPTKAEVIPMFETEYNGAVSCDYDGCHPCFSTRAAAEAASAEGART